MQDLARPIRREELSDLTIRIGSMSTQELDALRTQIDREHLNRFQRALEAVCRQFGYRVEDTLSVCTRGESSQVRLVVEY
jgi:cupin superfamily acireductone dioxygenase involved in methionine salvage